MSRGGGKVQMLVVTALVAILTGNALVLSSFLAPVAGDRIAAAGVALVLFGAGLVAADLLRERRS